MGCIWSKDHGVRCSRCNRSGDNLALNADNVCQKCVHLLQLGEYRRRLAALRSESTTNGTEPAAGLGVTPIYNIQARTPSRQFKEIPPRSAVRSLPRYTVSRKTSVKRKTIHRPPNKPKPLYGEFKCSLCKRAWSSSHSWKDTYQKCEGCGVHVFPHLQRALLKSDKPHSDKPHPQHLCQKCTQLGYYCGDYGRRIKK